MANNNRLELVIEVDVNRGNASIKTMNSSLSSLEQTATRVGRGASSGIDAITVSMAKGAAAGNLFADAIERGLGFAKEWTLGAVQTAAGVDQMRTSLHALAGSHNVSQEQTQRSIKTLKDLGFSTKEALLFTERMIIANIGLEKATRLATLARNAMATKFGTGGSPEEALEKIMMSIESGSSRGLRPYGLWVQFSKAQEVQAKLTGHALSEEEIQAIRLNDVFRAGHKIAGEYASIANGTAEKERLLKRDTEDLRIAFGEQLQNEFRKVIGYLSDLVGWATKNSTWLPKVTLGVIGLTTALVALNAVVNMGALQKLGSLLMLPGLWRLASALPTVITAIRTGMTGALVGLEVPLAAVVTAVGAVAAGFGVWWGGKWLLEHAQGNKRLETTCNHLQTIDGWLDKINKKRLGDLWDKHPYASVPKDQRKALATFLQERAQAARDAIAPHEPSEEEAARAERARAARVEGERTTKMNLDAAQEAKAQAMHDVTKQQVEDSMKLIETTTSAKQLMSEMMNVRRLAAKERDEGHAAIMEQEKKEREHLEWKADPKGGALEYFPLDAKALEQLHATTTLRLGAFDMKFNEEEERRITTLWKAVPERLKTILEKEVWEPMERAAFVAVRVGEWRDKIADQMRANAIQGVEERRNLAIQEVEMAQSGDARTVRDKIKLERTKTAIEVDAIRERSRLEMEQIDADTEREVRRERDEAMKAGVTASFMLQPIEDKVRAQGDAQKAAIRNAAAAQVDTEQMKLATSTGQVVTAEYRDIFQTLKREAGGVFDALLSKSESVWSAIGKSLKNAILGALKDIVTSQLAGAVMQMFVPGYQGGGRGHGGMGGGVLTGLGALFGRRQAEEGGGVAFPRISFGGGASNGASRGSGGGWSVPGFNGGSWGPGGASFGLPAMAGGGRYGMLALGLAAPMGSGGPSDVTVGPFGSSAPGAADGSSGSWGLNSIGLPGGTPWYMKPGALSNLTGGSGGAGKPGGGIGQWLGNLKKSFWNEDINLAPGKTVAASGIGGIKGDMAGVLTSQGAAGLYMAAGIPLGMAGLAGNSRGTWKGIGMSTAGGALVGASIGTMILPGIGTAIGAGVGAAAGFVAGGLEKLFGVESAQNEAKRLVKSIYGVSIDNALAQQIAEIAKQKYSGHVSMAVRDPDVRKTIELYAQASGQKMPISATTPHGASAVEQGGTMYQEATYNMGNPYTWRSSMPTLGGIGSSNYPSPGPTLMQVFVDGKGSGDYMAGNIFTPSFVQSRFSDAGQSSDGRTSNAAMLQQANLIVG